MNTAVTLSADLRFRRLDQEGVLVDQANGPRIVVVNEVGIRILEMLREGVAGNDLAANVASEYQVDPETAAKDVQSFLVELQSQGLVQGVVS